MTSTVEACRGKICVTAPMSKLTDSGSIPWSGGTTGPDSYSLQEQGGQATLHLGWSPGNPGAAALATGEEFSVHVRDASGAPVVERFYHVDYEAKTVPVCGGTVSCVEVDVQELGPRDGGSPPPDAGGTSAGDDGGALRDGGND